MANRQPVTSRSVLPRSPPHKRTSAKQALAEAETRAKLFLSTSPNYPISFVFPFQGVEISRFFHAQPVQNLLRIVADALGFVRDSVFLILSLAKREKDRNSSYLS